MSKDKEQKKEDERKSQIAAKVNFLSKFYPDAHSSPGGNIRIVRNTNLIKSEPKCNSDGGTGETLNRNLALESSLLKRKSKNIHTVESCSSPSKRLKLSTFPEFQFWCRKDTPSIGSFTGPYGEPTQKMEGQESGGKKGVEKVKFQRI